MEQKRVLLNWMGTKRYVYNRVLEKIKKDKESVNFYSLRNKYVIKKNNSNVSEWETKTPKDIRASAIKDLVNNIKSNYAFLKRRTIKGFKMSFLSRKRSIPSIEIPKSAITMSSKDIMIYPRYISTPIKRDKKKYTN